jgi:hypothetical protein
MSEAIGPSNGVDCWDEREGVVQFWNAMSKAFEDTGETVLVVADGETLNVADVGQIVPCVPHNGKLLAISWRTVRHAKTVAGPDAYPTDTAARVFRIKFTDLLYTETAGATTFTSGLIDAAEDYDAYVCNLHGDTFIPENTIIEVFLVKGQWYTCYSAGFAKKPFIEFELTGALTTSDSSAAAKIKVEWGPGTAAGVDSAITVVNASTRTAGLYKYHGVIGRRGQAIHVSGTTYRIIDMEC